MLRLRFHDERVHDVAEVLHELADTIPDLPGARCKGHTELFDRTIAYPHSDRRALTAEESSASGRSPSSVSYRMIFVWPNDFRVADHAVGDGCDVARQAVPVRRSLDAVLTVRGQLHHKEAVITRAAG